MKLSPDNRIKNKETGIFFLLYGIGIAAILPYALWYVNNPDSYQYISIARKLSKGNFSAALNGYWSPMLSWLIAFPLSLGIDGIISIKWIQVLIGLFTIDSWIRLSSLLELEGWTKRLVRLAAIPFVLNYAILNPTPDLLFMTLVLYCLFIFIRNEWMFRWRESVFLAILGSLLYFAKAFGFPLFVLLLFISAAFSLKANDAPANRRRLLFIGLIFICISSLWIIPLSVKYGKITISEAVNFNMSKEVAPLPEKIMHLPILNGPLLRPLDTESISAWESPGDVVKLSPLAPFSSKENFNYYLRIIKRNLLTIWYFDFRNQAGIIFLVILIFFLTIRGGSVLLKNRSTLFLFSALIAFYAGYSLILVHTRYIWICTWIMLLISALMLQLLSGNTKWKIIFYQSLLLLLLLLAVKRPVKEILFTQDSDMQMLWYGKGITHPFETMKITYRPDEQLRQAAISLTHIPDIIGGIASLKTVEGERHEYSSSLFIADALQKQYFGPLEDTLSIDQTKMQLQKNGISLFLVWNHKEWRANNQDWVKLLFANKLLGLSVYKLNF